MAWANGYTYRRTVTLDHTQVPSTQTNFPVAIVGTFAYLKTAANGGELQNSSGFDCIFTSDSAGATLLDWERVSYVSSTGAVEFWIRIPSLSSSADTVIYLWTNNSSVTTDQSNTAGTWTTGYVDVQHMGDGTTISVADSTGTLSPTNNGATAISGKLGGAAHFTAASSQYVDFGTNSALDIHGNITIECWVWADTTFDGYVIARIQGSPLNYYIVLLNGSGPFAGTLAWAVSNAGTEVNTTTGFAITTGQWIHLCCTYNGTNGILYYNGGSVGTPFNQASAIGAQGANNAYLSKHPSAARYWNGRMDEVRVSNVARSADWIRTSYNNQNNPSGFSTIGSATIFAIQPAAPIPSRASWGSPAVQLSTIKPAAAIPSRVHWPTPSIPGVISPAAAIPSRRFWATPSVQLDTIIPTVIPSRSTWNGPTVTVQQTITPAAAIPTRVAWPTTARVAHIQVIAPAAAIPSRVAWPAPEVMGAPQAIATAPIPSRLSWPAPSVDGGQLSVRVYVGAVDRSNYLSLADNLMQIQSQTIGRWKATFTLVVPGGVDEYLPEVGQTCIVIDHGPRVFAGCIQSVQRQRPMMAETLMFYNITATDKSAICDHRVCKGQYIFSGDDVVTVLRSIVAASLNGEGIFLDPTMAPGDLGVMPADLPLNFISVTNAFDQIAQYTGTVWWVDAFGQLTFSQLVDLPAAPFNLTETSLNWRNFTVTETTQDYYNALYAVSNLNLLPGGGGAGVTETFIWANGEPGIIVSPVDGSPVGINTSAGIKTVIGITVNGVRGTAVNFFTAPITPDAWFYGAGPGNPQGSTEIQPSSLIPTIGSTVVINYVPFLANNSSTAQTGDPLAPTIGSTCGSGVYEGVIQVQNIATQADLDAIAAAELGRIGGVPQVVKYETDTPGLAPGQLQNINVPLGGADNLTCLITQVSGVAIFPVLKAGGAFRWNVEARTNLDPGNATKWFERLVLRTANPLPVDQFDIASWVLGAGSSLAGGVALANPYIVTRTVQLAELWVSAGTPPTGQDLVLSIIRASDSAVIASITLPSTALPNGLTIYTIPTDQPTYLFAQDVLTITATYQATGGAIAKAANVTLIARGVA